MQLSDWSVVCYGRGERQGEGRGLRWPVLGHGKGGERGERAGGTVSRRRRPEGSVTFKKKRKKQTAVEGRGLHYSY